MGNLHNLNGEDYKENIQGSPIICLCETFRMEETIKLPGFLKKYKCIVSKATKIKSMGRARGGMCILYREDLIELMEKISITESWSCIKININGKEYIICNTYIDKGNEQTIRTLGEMIMEIKEKTSAPILIGGDFNARIRESNQIEEIITESTEFTHYRQAKDTTRNKAGRILGETMEEAGMIVLNGRSKTDKDGQYTYIDTKGCSTIDMAWVDINILQELEDFKIIEMGTSDHLPIKIC